jgi:3-hydroxyacyl-CoA dehydrogenase, C-terminal domain
VIETFRAPDAPRQNKNAIELMRGERFPGMNGGTTFHLPVALSNVVDLMPHPGTDPAVVAALDAFAREIGQIPPHYKQEYHGYIFNSIFGAIQRQALDLVIEGVASFEDVDRSWMGIFKMPVGPFWMYDQIGLDTIAEILAQGTIATMQGNGASLSGLAAGEIVDHFGYSPAFFIFGGALCSCRPLSLSFRLSLLRHFLWP